MSHATSSKPSVTYRDLEDAFDWVSVAGDFDGAAYISRATGRMFYASDMQDATEELPDDIGDDALYLSVPHKHDLDLGRSLVFRFVAECLPEETRTVQDCFRRRGAYGRFKDLLERRGRLQQWYRYEHEATKRALLEWADDEGLHVTDVPPAEV